MLWVSRSDAHSTIIVDVWEKSCGESRLTWFDATTCAAPAASRRGEHSGHAERASPASPGPHLNAAERVMDILAGVVGGLGLFIVGMWFLTENLKKLASRRLRLSAQRWTTNPYAALLWGTLAGGITQSMTALTFIVVSILRSAADHHTGRARNHPGRQYRHNGAGHYRHLRYQDGGALCRRHCRRRRGQREAV